MGAVSAGAASQRMQEGRIRVVSGLAPCPVRHERINVSPAPRMVSRPRAVSESIDPVFFWKFGGGNGAHR